MRRYVPNQHGAWAMLIIPFLFGIAASQPVFLHILLFAGWLLVYLFTYPLLQWIRTGKKLLYAKPMIVYGSLLIPVGTGLMYFHPSLAKWALIFVPCFLINCYYAKRNRERALINDLAAVLQFGFIVFVSYDVGGGENWRLAAELFCFSILYFAGTVFYVKTIIRERNNRTYYLFSVVYHLAFLVLAVFLFPKLLFFPVAVLLMRAIYSPRTKLTVKQIGMLEIAYSAMVAIAAIIAYA